MDPIEVQIGSERDSDSLVNGLSDSIVDVNFALDNFLARRLGTGGILDINVVFDEFMSLQLYKFDEVLQANKHLFLAEIYRRVNGSMDSLSDGLVSDELLQRRTAALWAGLRRVYFHEVEQEPEAALSDDSFLSRKRSRVPDDLNTPVPRIQLQPDDPDDSPAGPSLISVPLPYQPADDFDSPRTDCLSNGEDIDDGDIDDGRTKHDDGEKWEVKWSPDLDDITKLAKGFPLGEKLPQLDFAKDFTHRSVFMNERFSNDYSSGEDRPERQKTKKIDSERQKTKKFDSIKAFLSESTRSGINFVDLKVCMSIKTIRHILACKAMIHKYGVFVPRNDREADSSPEAARWASGRQLEWIRLQEQGIFERNWDWERLRKVYSDYSKKDIGHVFYVYDHKHSGEYRVRLVFDGSRQNPETYTDTYAPTARGESVRLFHVYAVEEAWEIAQFDVPQAFLRSPINCILFVYPPKGFIEFPGQLLKLRLSLYGAKQSAALWNKMIDTFLRGLGFSPSPMDPCLYKRDNAIIILFCDDLRVAGLPETVQEIKAALYKEFQITTSDGTRFLGIDTCYDIKQGYFKLHMETYITSTYERFSGFDLTTGVPYREIVGCLLWICLCVMDPELLRVKDLARRSNEYTEEDYEDAIKVLHRIYERRTHGIIFLRGGAGKEIVPSSSRNGVMISAATVPNGAHDDNGTVTTFNELVLVYISTGQQGESKKFVKTKS